MYSYFNKNKHNLPYLVIV